MKKLFIENQQLFADSVEMYVEHIDRVNMILKENAERQNPEQRVLSIRENGEYPELGFAIDSYKSTIDLMNRYDYNGYYLDQIAPLTTIAIVKRHRYEIRETADSYFVNALTGLGWSEFPKRDFTMEQAIKNLQES